MSDEVPIRKAGRPRKTQSERGKHVKIWVSAELERRLRAKHVRPGESLPETVRRLLLAVTAED